MEWRFLSKTLAIKKSTLCDKSLIFGYAASDKKGERETKFSNLRLKPFFKNKDLQAQSKI